MDQTAGQQRDRPGPRSGVCTCDDDSRSNNHTHSNNDSDYYDDSGADTVTRLGPLNKMP